MIVKLQPREEDGAFIIFPSELLNELNLRDDEWVQLDILDRTVETDKGLSLPVERVVRISKIRM